MLKLRRNEEGFTLVEVVVCLAIMLATGFLAWAGINQVADALRKSGVVSRVSAQRALLARAIERFCERIEIPYWIANVKTEEAPEGLVIPWLDGDSEAALKVHLVGVDELVIEAPDFRRSFMVPGLSKLSLFRDAAKRPVAVKVEFEDGSSCMGLFSGVPADVYE